MTVGGQLGLLALAHSADIFERDIGAKSFFLQSMLHGLAIKKGRNIMVTDLIKMTQLIQLETN